MIEKHFTPIQLEIIRDVSIEFAEWYFNKKQSIAFVDPTSKFYLMTTSELFSEFIKQKNKKSERSK